VTSSLPALIALKFIQRRDVKAIQFDNGDYVPDFRMKDKSRHGEGFKKSHLDAHLEGRETYGHYLIDANDKCRIFCLDVDLEKSKYDSEGNVEEHGGSYVKLPDMANVPPQMDPDQEELWFKENTEVVDCDPRLAWSDRRNVAARSWYKYQMKMIGSRLASVITKQMNTPCVVTYSGNKGIHVYGLMGESRSIDCHRGAMIALRKSGEWELYKGKNFYRHINQDPIMGYPSFSIETFPKQDSLAGKDLGNLLRLPLGKNLKNPKDPTFFLNLNGRMGDFAPHPNPIQLLESGDPFQ